MKHSTNGECRRANLLARATTSAAIYLALFVFDAPAQTPQPYVFAGSVNNNQYSLTTLQRDDAAGALTAAPNTNVALNNPCYPSEVDAHGRFLFGICVDGLSMYTLEPTTGAVAELAASPFAVSTGNFGILAAAEGTGQYVYLLKAILPGTETMNSLILDTFQIDPVTPALVPVSSQTISVIGQFVGAVKDPRHHGFAVYLNQQVSGSNYPAAVLYTIQFDPLSGQAILDPTGGKVNDSGARAIAISPTGNYLATGSGPAVGNLTIYQIALTAFSLTNVGAIQLGAELNAYNFPDSIYFNSSGELIYAQGPPTDPTANGLPFYMYESATTLQIPSSPVPYASANFLNATVDPQGPFRYATVSGGGVQVYQIDVVTGLPAANSQLQSPFLPGLAFAYLFAPLGPSGDQGIVGPAIAQSTLSLSFGATAAGQTSGVLPVTLSSSGDQPVTFTSITITGANAGDFRESDTCLAPPVLTPNHACVVSVTYEPAAMGMSQATLVIADNVPGSPQQVALGGTASAGATPTPAASLASPGTFPPSGAITQGTSGTPQNATLSNTGSAPLHVTNVALNGLNASDFAIGNTNCAGTLEAGGKCTIPITFSPTAAGVRTTNLVVTDDAANSPQSLTLTGNAAPAVMVQVASSGSTSATVTAGQTAQFNLQARAGAGFTGALSFACTGAPFGAVCNAPTSVALANGNTVSFTVSVTTLAATQTMAVPMSRSKSGSGLQWFVGILALIAFAVFFVCLLGFQKGQLAASYSRRVAYPAGVLLLGLLLAAGIGCSGGAGAPQSAPQVQAQAAATPAMQPGGGTFSSAQMVALSDGTTGATIYFTTDGSTPSTSSPVYSTPISMTSATTVQAVAVASGYSNSAVASASYNFKTPSGTFTITVTPTATAMGSSKTLQVTPIALTLKVE